MRHTGSLALLTDLYELTMMQGYFFESPGAGGVFEMFFRRMPFDGGYAVFAGLGPLLEEIELLHFTAEDISYLKAQGMFRDEFLEYLSSFAFRGNVYSMKEGTICFPNEPLLSVEGTLMETQLIESMVLNFINFQTLIATKTARIAEAAGGRPVLEFGLRRAHGIDGSLSASRASYIGGASSTSNVLAGRLYGIPVSGTMAHSWVMIFATELESFEKYAGIYPERCILLVDTFDTLKSGVPNAMKVFSAMRDRKIPGLKGIRIDSGDLEYLSKKAREMLDGNGFSDVRIFVSSDMDESIIAQLIASGSPIDAWGVGTRMVTGWNDPALTGVYKIVAKSDANGKLEPCIKISNQSEKITNPGVKNVMRFYDREDRMLADLLYAIDEEEDLLHKIRAGDLIRFNHPFTSYEGFTMKEYNRGEIQLREVMKEGKITVERQSLAEMRKVREEGMKSLDRTFKRLINPHVYRISLSESVNRLKAELIRGIQSTYP